MIPETEAASCLWRQACMSRALKTTPRESEELTLTTAVATLLEGVFRFSWHLPAADLHALKSPSGLYSPPHYFAGQAGVHIFVHVYIHLRYLYLLATSKRFGGCFGCPSCSIGFYTRSILNPPESYRGRRVNC
jgi:hypothetical protein